MFKSLLIANRGEIACRVIRACDELGIESVAIFSEADVGALHTLRATKSHNVGPAPAPESYLNGERIIELAKEYGCDALHPGYGFLSENVAFADRCEQNAIKFVGPSSGIISLMGDKAAARATAKAANVPIVPGSDLIDDPALAQKLAEEEIGYPLLVKATGGGGGMGIIVVETPTELAEAIKTAGQIGERTFGNAGIYLEKLLTDVAHVEVQVAGDEHGNAVHFFERNCSVQRRNQKLIEETPAQFMSAAQTDDICEAAVRLAQHVNYNSVGTVEFLFDREGQKFYFIEMNTRIQVEHPITEMTTGVDLINTQIRIAAGEPLPEMGLTQAQIKRQGVALEARVLAEDSHAQTPSPGTITQYEEPTGPDLRVDSGVFVGTEINTYYDSLMAKIIAFGTDRETARRQLVRALHLYKVQGISTNIVLLLDILESPLFKTGDYNTRILQLLKDEQGERVFSTAEIAALAVALHFGREQPASVLQTAKDGNVASPARWWSENHKRLLKRRMPKLAKGAK